METTRRERKLFTFWMPIALMIVAVVLIVAEVARCVFSPESITLVGAGTTIVAMVCVLLCQILTLTYLRRFVG